MAERPILFGAPMVRALLAGTKTQTRRVVKAQPDPLLVAGAQFIDRFWCWLSGHDGSITEKVLGTGRCPYGQPGDRLWVREAWGFFDPNNSGEDYSEKGAGDSAYIMASPTLWKYWLSRTAYAATFEPPKYGVGPDRPAKWRPSIHMPRWASRITLEITNVRVERLNDISLDDAYAEGAADWAAETVRDGNKYPSAIKAYCALWESINGPDSWAANPWVWCVEFKRVTA